MLRPYDTLCELLASSQGSETDAIKTYFKNFTDNQACVACLTIICDQSLKNIKVCPFVFLLYINTKLFIFYCD